MFKAHDLYFTNPIFCGTIFSVMEQIRSGELLHKATQKKKAEKTKLKKLNMEQNVSPLDRNIYSKFYIWLLYISWPIFHDIYLLFSNTLATHNTDDTETEEENEDTA